MSFEIALMAISAAVQAAQTKAAAELVTTTTGTGVGSSTNIVMPETVPEGMEMLQSVTQEYSNVVPKQSVATSPSPSPHKMLARHPKTELALQKHSLGASYKSQLASFTPLSSEAAPTMMKSYMAGLKGMTATQVIDGKEYPADGDIIISVDDKEVRKISDILIHLQREKSVGDSMVLGVVRDGEFMHISLELVERPDL